MNLIQNGLIRKCAFGVGWILTGIGIVGLFVPLLPATPFLIAAAWCFLRSSPRAHEWLMQNKFLGPALRRWEERRAISLKVKITATLMLAFSAVTMWLKISQPGILFVSWGLIAGVLIYIWTRPHG